MFNKILYFLKYNNATVIILAVILILGGGALAAGPENLGQKRTSIRGLDNTLLLAADLETFNMDFKINLIEQDENYYYIDYSFLDLTVADSAWQYQLREARRKVSKKIQEDLGVYLTKYLAKHYESRMRELKAEKARAESSGAGRRLEVTEYSGLVGRTLDLAAKVFPGYEPVKKRELPAPDFSLIPGHSFAAPLAGERSNGADNLTEIYNNYVAAHDLDRDGVLDAADNCQEISNADQFDADADGLGDVCDADGASAPLIKGNEGGLGEAASSTPEIIEDPDQAAPGSAPDPAETPSEAGTADESAVPAEESALEPTNVEIIELSPAESAAPETEPTPGL